MATSYMKDKAAWTTGEQSSTQRPWERLKGMQKALEREPGAPITLCVDNTGDAQRRGSRNELGRNK